MIITFKCCISIYSILVIFSFWVSLRKLLPAGFSHAQNLAIIVNSEFSLSNLTPFGPYIGWLLIISFYVSQNLKLSYPKMGTLFYVIWNLGSSINCLFLTLQVIGHQVLSIIPPNFILRTFELCFFILIIIVPIQILRVTYLDNCNYQNDFLFSSLVPAITFYFCFLDSSSQLFL